MSKMLACYKNEIAKLFSYKKYTVFIIVEAVICALAVLLKSLLSSMTDGVFTLSSTNVSMILMSLILELFLPIVVMMAACDLFSTEYQNETIKATLIRPVSRFKVYISKILACLTFAVINMLVVLVFANVLESIVIGNTAAVGIAFAAYLIDIFPLLVVLLMAVFINQLSKGSTLAMFLCIIVYILLVVLGTFVPYLSGLMFVGYMQWHKLFLGVNQPISSTISKIGLLFGYGLVFFSGGYYMFLRRE